MCAFSNSSVCNQVKCEKCPLENNCCDGSAISEAIVNLVKDCIDYENEVIENQKHNDD